MFKKERQPGRLILIVDKTWSESSVVIERLKLSSHFEMKVGARWC